MKKMFTLFFATIICGVTVQAQKVVALHSPTNGIQYFNDDYSFQTAYEAAIVGDTIYLPGGTHFPPSVFEKQLTIFGAGYHPSATTATFATKISGTITLSDEADNFHLEGVEITGNITIDYNESVNNITIKRCKWGSLNSPGNAITNPSENNNFIENVIGTVWDIRNMRTSTFLNNIIAARVPYNLHDLIFLNNLFLHTTSSYNTIIYANNCVFKNNVFLNVTNSICGGVGTSSWESNIFCTPSTTPILGTDPTFSTEHPNYFMTLADVLVDQTGQVFDYDHDYHLQATATLNLGDDGTETGIYGGFYP